MGRAACRLPASSQRRCARTRDRRSSTSLERPVRARRHRPRAAMLLRVVPFLGGARALRRRARRCRRGAPRRWWIALCAGFALVNLYAAEARAYGLLALAGLGDLPARRRPSRRIARPPRGALPRPRRPRSGSTISPSSSSARRSARAVGRRSWIGAASARRGARRLRAVGLRSSRSQPAEAMAWTRETLARRCPGLPVSALGGVGRIPGALRRRCSPGATLAGALVGAALAVLLVRRPLGRGPCVRRAPLRGDRARTRARGLALAPVAFAGRARWRCSPSGCGRSPARAPGRPTLAPSRPGAVGRPDSLATLVVAFGPHPRSTRGLGDDERGPRLARPGDTLARRTRVSPSGARRVDRGRLAGSRRGASAESDAATPGLVHRRREPAPPKSASYARTWTSLPGLAALPAPAALVHTPAVMRILFARGTVREIVRQTDAVLLVWSASRLARRSASTRIAERRLLKRAGRRRRGPRRGRRRRRTAPASSRASERHEERAQRRRQDIASGGGRRCRARSARRGTARRSRGATTSAARKSSRHGPRK